MTRMLVVLAVLTAAVVVFWAAPAPAQDIPRVTTPQLVGGRLPDAGTSAVALDTAGYLRTAAAPLRCESLVVRTVSCGTTPAVVPTSRTAGSAGLEIVNSPENSGSPKVKCDVNPTDGGVGFGATNPGLVRSPGESLYLALDSTHTVVCVCDTPATGLTTTECVQ
jgi:hypothetical protein